MTTQIHPTVIMNISEHHTRARASKQQPEIVIGALLGNKSEQKVEIVDSFELQLSKDESSNLMVDKEFYHKKLPLVKQVDAELDLIGWYGTTPSLNIKNTITTADYTDFTLTYNSLHRQVSELIPNPLFLRLNPHKRETDPKISGTLPLELFEPVIMDIDTEQEKMEFIEVTWQIVTEDVEIIGLEHSAKMSHVTVAPSAAIDNLRLQYSAVKMLKDRIRVISKFVKDVQAGTLPPNTETLTEIAKLTKRFPLMSSEQYANAYNIQCNDVALNTYLGILTKLSMCKLHFGVPVSKTRAYSTTQARR